MKLALGRTSSGAHSGGISRDWAAVAIGLTLALVGLTLGGASDRADNLFYDWSTRIAQRPTPDNIVVVAIDDESLAALGPWPWPRSVHAAMLRRLAAYRPLAVVYDVLFLGPSPRSEDDDDLGRALAAVPNVFAPLLLKTPGSNGRGYDPERPVDPTRRGTAMGHALVQPDDDRVVRRLNLALDGERRWTHIAAMAANLGPEGHKALTALPGVHPPTRERAPAQAGRDTHFVRRATRPVSHRLLRKRPAWRDAPSPVERRLCDAGRHGRRLRGFLSRRPSATTASCRASRSRQISSRPY